MRIRYVVLKCGTDAGEMVEKIMRPKEDVLHGDGTCGGTESSPLEKESIYRLFKVIKLTPDIR